MGSFAMPICDLFSAKSLIFPPPWMMISQGQGKACLGQALWSPSMAQQHNCRHFWESLLSGKVEASKSSVSLGNLIVCASAVITFQICSVLSGKLNSPAHLQENKCTSYCLLGSASSAVWFLSFQWACCDFVLTD